METFANIRLEAWKRRIEPVRPCVDCDRLPLCYTCFTPFHARHRCQGSFSRGRGRHVQRIHSTFAFAIGHRSQPRFGETCREKEKNPAKMFARALSTWRGKYLHVGNVFIFESPASAKCHFHESSSLSPSRRFEYNVSRNSTNASYMNLNRKL